MKNIFVILLSVAGIYYESYSQSTVSGRVYDKETGVSMPYATVTILGVPDSTILAGMLTDAEGRFVFSDIKKGGYLIRFSFVGFTPVTLPLLLGELNKNYDVGKVELSVSAEEMNEVVVEARRAMVAPELDRKLFSVEDNPAASGGSVLDFMKSLPGITVDQEGKVLLRGSDKVSVLIDGKQSSLTGFGNQKGLDNISAGNIDHIEIINNPSAKYDAAGMAGVINIVYRKEKKSGLSGDLGFTYGLGMLSKRRADLPTNLGSYSLNSKYMPGLSVNYNTKSVNFFLQGELMRLRKLPNNEFTTRNYSDTLHTLSQVPENRKQTHYIIKGGVDLLLNEHNTVTFSAIYDYEHHYDTAQVPYFDAESLQRYRYWGWLEYEITGYMNYSALYKHKFAAPGHELNIGLQYTKGWEDESYYLTDSSSYRQSVDSTHIIATEHTTTFTADYTKPLKFGRLEAGLKFQWRRIPVTYTTGKGELSIIYPGLGEWSKWGESTYSGYLNYIYERTKYDIETGIRLERTDVYYDLAKENIYYPENDRYDYLRLFPNMRFTWKINTSNSISLFYNRRIDRPGEPEVRVFPKYDDPELLKVGNPYLRPQLTQNFEAAYKMKWQQGSLFISLYYRIINDPYTRIYSPDTTNKDYTIVNKIYHNTGSAASTGTEIVLSQNLTGNIKLSGSLNWYRNNIHAFKGELLFPYERKFEISETKDNTWYAKINSQFLLPWQIQAQLTWIYYAPVNIQQGRQLSRSSLDVGMKKNIMKGKGEVNFSFTDIFNRFGIRQQINNDGLVVIYENFYETQAITLGLRFKF